MKKILLFLFGLVTIVGATQNTVTGAFSEGSIQSTDTVIIGNTGTVTIDGSYTCVALKRPASCTQTLTRSGTSKLTLTGTGIVWDDSGSGVHVIPDSLIFTGANAKMRISSGAGARFASTSNGYPSVIKFCGADTLLDYKGGNWGSFEIDSGKSLYCGGDKGVTFSYTGTGLRLRHNATFNNAAGALEFQQNGNGRTLRSDNGSIISAITGINIRPQSGSFTDTLDDFNYLGSAINFIVWNNNTGTQKHYYRRLSLGTCPAYLLTRGSGNMANRFIGDSIVCGALNIGADDDTMIDSLYFGSTIIKPTSLTSTYGTEKTYLNLESSQWFIPGNFNFGSKPPVTAGTSTINIINTSTATTNNKTFYDWVDHPGSGNTVTHADSLLLGGTGDFSILSGTGKIIGKTIRCFDLTVASGAAIIDTTSLVYISGNVSFGNTATRTKGTGKYILSSGATHTFASGTGLQKFDTISVLGSTTFSGSDSAKIRMADGVKISGGTHVLLSGYDIEGSSGSIDSLDGMTIDIPADATIDYTYFKNVTLATGDTINVGANGIDGGGNSGNIIFPVLDTVPVISGIDDSLVYFGDTVTVSGTIFGAAPTLYVDGGLVPTISVSATEIVFRTTDLSQGLKQLIVKNNTYSTYDTSTLYYNQIVIDSIRPEHGIAGDTLSVYGFFVASEPSVKVGDSTIITFVSRTDSLCSFRAVTGYVGQVAVIVYRSGLGYADTIRFDYDTIPVMSSALPLFSKLAPPAGYLDTITGTGLDQIDTIFYGDSMMINPKSRSYTQWIDTIRGYHVKGGQSFISVSQYGYRDTLATGITFKNLHISSMTPSSGKAGDTITMRAIWGLKTSGLTVKIDTASATVLAGYTDTLAHIIAPVNPKGYNKAVEVVNSDDDTTYTVWSYPFDNQGGGRGSSTSGRGLIIGAE